MMTSKKGVFTTLLLIIVQITALVELPRVEDNNILTTETAIRNTINTLFSSLQLKDVKKKPRLKEYSIVHNHLISFTLQDYSNLKEIAKLTRVDKKGTNNQTMDFMTALNDLLNNDIEKDNKYIVDGINDDIVTKYVKQLLATIESLKEKYGVNNENWRIKNEIYEILKENEIASYNDTVSDDKFDKTEEEDPVLGKNYFWKPEKPTRRVFEGERVKIKYFPFIVSIHIFNQFYCSGSIIKSDLIITASSCLQLAYNNRFFRENPAFLSVRVGSTFYINGGENIPVMEVYFHPEYNPKNLRNNICILRLVRKINLKRKRVKKIDFDRYESTLPSTTDGITILGWGAKSANNRLLDPWHQQLAFAVLDFYPLRECQDVYSKEFVTYKNFCAGFFSKGGGACNRDVGAPGIVENTLVGVASFGSPLCGTPDAPTVFTKLGYYTDWIEEIMEQDVPSGTRRTTLMPDRPVVTIPDYTITERTTFKIPPLTGTISPIPIHEVDSLRTLKNSEIFQDFLKTMFMNYENVLNQEEQDQPQAQPQPDTETDLPGDKIEYQDMMEKSAKHATRGATVQIETVTATPMVIAPLTSSHIEEFVDMPKPVTSIGDVEPEVVEKYTMTEAPEISAKKLNAVMQVNREADLEKDLVDLIDNLDLTQIIKHMSSLDENKIIDDSKLLEIIGKDNVNSKLANKDDNVLTLLYLSDSDRKAVQKQETEVNNAEVEDDDDDDDDDDKNDSEPDGTSGKGLSIEVHPFKDMTFRGKNVSTFDRLLSEGTSTNCRQDFRKQQIRRD